MRNIIYIFILILFCMCNQNIKNIENVVFGVLNNAPKNSVVKLIERNGNTFDVVDSVLVQDSVFKFIIKASKLSFYAIQIDNKDFLIHFLADSCQKIIIKIDYKSLKQYKIFNSLHSEKIMICENKLDSCNKIIVEKIKNNLPYNEVIDSYRTEMLSYLNSIKSSPAVIVLLSQKFIDGQIVFPIENYLNLYKNVLSMLEKDYSKLNFYLILKNFVKKYEIEIQQNAQPNTTDNVYSFKARTIDGKTFMFEKYSNKYVLLCFWASWQFESKNTNLLLKDIADKYPQINIVQIGLETNPKIVEDSLIKYNFKHNIIVEPLVWHSEIVQAYKVTQLPTYLLIYNNKIIFKTNDNELINKKLKETF